jgi:hypothetical protein
VSDIVPPSLGLGGAATQTTPAGVAGTVTNPPQAVAQLPSGAIVHGTVIRLDGRHRALVRTDLGTLEVASHAQLSLGSQVTLQIRTAGSQLHVVILQVDGHPPHVQPPVSSQTGGAGATASPGRETEILSPGQPPESSRPGGAAASTGRTTDVLALGQRLEAVLQSLPPQPAGTPSHAQGGPVPVVGTRFQLRVLRIQGPDSPRGDWAALPQAGGATPKSGGQTAAAHVIPAVVTGVTTSGEPVVETSLGILALGLKAALPRGTRLLLELPNAGFPQDRSGAPQAAAPQAAHSAALAFGWTALEEALELLQKVEAPVAQAQTPPPAVQAIPRPGPRLTSTILFFLQALSGGDLRSWLGGRAVEALESAGRGDLLSRLNQDFAQLARLSEPAGGDWRLLAVPLFDGSHIQQLRLFLRRRNPRSGHGDDKADAATRFVLEVALARFGDLQLDGLVRDQRFDLILRSRRPLSSEMHRDITDIFNDANSAAGQHGQITFQASGDWSFMALDSGRTAGAGLLA